MASKVRRKAAAPSAEGHAISKDRPARWSGDGEREAGAAGARLHAARTGSQSRAPREGNRGSFPDPLFFHTMETFFPLCGNLSKTFSIAWKTIPPSVRQNIKL